VTGTSEEPTRACDGPLSGLRVLLLGATVASRYCARLLADLGANVVRGVDPASPSARPGGLAASQHLYLGLNVREVYLGDEASAAAIRSWPDVIIEDESAAGGERLGSQVRVRVSDFGRSGPHMNWHGSDLVDAAYGGGCQQNGEPGRPPLRPPADVASYEIGLNAAVATMLAALVLLRDGHGQDVEVSGVDCWATVQTAIGTLEFIFQGRIAQRAGRRFAGRGYPYTILPCKDGEVRLIALVGREWARALDMMGNPEWGASSRFADRLVNQEVHADELDRLVGQWLEERTRAEILEQALKFHVPWAPVQTVSELLGDPHVAHNAFLVATQGVRVPGPVAKFGGRRFGVRSDTTTVPLELPTLLAGELRPSSPQPGGPAAAPLAGIRVVDFGWAWAGGVVGSVLADFGAEVIKVESHRRMEPMRFDRPILDGAGPSYELGGLHHNVNRNKKSIRVDITTPEGQEIVRELAAASDVLIENLSPEALSGKGLGHADLCELNPRLIYLSLSAVGRSGPYAGIRAYAPVLTALSGMDSMTGYRGEPALGLQQGLADPNAGLHGALAVLAALYARGASGQGSTVEVSQLEALIALMGGHLAAAQLGIDAVPIGNEDLDMAPSGVYPAAGDDQWVAISCQSDEDWHHMREALGNPGWAADPELDAVDGRRARAAEIDDHLRAWAAGQDRWAVAEQLQAHGIAAAPLLDTGDRFADDHLQARDVYVTVEHPLTGTEFLCGLPWRLSATPGSVRTPAPLLGQHTAEVLSEVLGMDQEKIAALDAAGVLN
jgi:crotonobetainyl-CoA:carnitine CoA-transferase CaiB-like acyl-CoA transferase